MLENAHGGKRGCLRCHRWGAVCMSPGRHVRVLGHVHGTGQSWRAIPFSSRASHSRQDPSSGEAMQTASGTGRATRSDDGRAGPGYPVERYESEHIGPWGQSSQQQCATVDRVRRRVWGGRRVTSDAVTDRRNPDGKVAMALEGPDLQSGAYAWIAARQAATMTEPHSIHYDAQTRLLLDPRRRLNSCHTRYLPIVRETMGPACRV
jgi:hypothetical protein